MLLPHILAVSFTALSVLVPGVPAPPVIVAEGAIAVEVAADAAALGAVAGEVEFAEAAVFAAEAAAVAAGAAKRSLQRIKRSATDCVHTIRGAGMMLNFTHTGYGVQIHHVPSACMEYAAMIKKPKKAIFNYPTPVGGSELHYSGLAETDYWTMYAIVKKSNGTYKFST